VTRLGRIYRLGEGGGNRGARERGWTRIEAAGENGILGRGVENPSLRGKSLRDQPTSNIADASLMEKKTREKHPLRRNTLVKTRSFEGKLLKGSRVINYRTTTGTDAGQERVVFGGGGGGGRVGWKRSRSGAPRERKPRRHAASI